MNSRGHGRPDLRKAKFPEAILGAVAIFSQPSSVKEGICIGRKILESGGF